VGLGAGSQESVVSTICLRKYSKKSPSLRRLNLLIETCFERNRHKDNIVISKAPFLEEVFQEIKQIISCFREKSPNTQTVMLKKSLSGNREQFLMP
jgi:hypothetical protein